MGRSTVKFGDFSVHNEWQAHKSGEYLFKQAKKDRKKVGELRKYSATNCAEFVLERRSEDLVYNKDAWAIPKSIISLMRCLGSPDLAIRVSNGDLFQIAFKDMVERGYSKPDPKTVSYCFVNFSEFSLIKGSPESIESSMMVGKWK